MTNPFAVLRRIVHGGLTPGQSQELARACLEANALPIDPVTYHPPAQITLAALDQVEPAPRRRVMIAAHHVAVLPDDDPNGLG
jgi:hypothetical protein